MTLKVIRRLQDFSSVIRRTFVQYFTRFQLTACSRSLSATAWLIVMTVVMTGSGYRLYIVKSPSCIPENVLNAIKVHIPGVQLESSVGAELSFMLPKEQSANFETLFTDLEFNQTALGINSFGASVAALEEVFLK